LVKLPFGSGKQFKPISFWGRFNPGIPIPPPSGLGIVDYPLLTHISPRRTIYATLLKPFPETPDIEQQVATFRKKLYISGAPGSTIGTFHPVLRSH
jgi:hypothetical protein